MNAEEQITGVLNVLDHARSVTVSGQPVVIKRDSFEQYPDYEAVLEKLADEYSVLKVIQYPVMDDVDYRANIGFYPEADLLDRAILLGLKRINPDARLSEDEFWKTFNDHRPRLLGAVFNVISEALKIIDEVELEWHPRMAVVAQSPQNVKQRN